MMINTHIELSTRGLRKLHTRSRWMQYGFLLAIAHCTKLFIFWTRIRFVHHSCEVIQAHMAWKISAGCWDGLVSILGCVNIFLIKFLRIFPYFAGFYSQFPRANPVLLEIPGNLFSWVLLFLVGLITFQNIYEIFSEFLELWSIFHGLKINSELLWNFLNPEINQFRK
jgi:hypothetical protein